MSTATIHRKDLTAEDARIVGRFKHYLMMLLDAGKFDRSTIECKIAGRVQQWYKTVGWEKNNTLERQDKRCYRLTMRQFRAVVACLKRDDIAVTEGLVIHILLRFSLFCLDGRGGAWKWPDGCVYFERQRLSPLGTLRKRNPDSAKARLERFHKERIKAKWESPHQQLDSYEECAANYYENFEYERESCFEADAIVELEGLEREVAAAQRKKEQKRSEVDKNIATRKGWPPRRRL